MAAEGMFFLEEFQPINEEKISLVGGPVVKNPPANAGDTGSIPGLRRSDTPRGNQAHEPQLLRLRSRAREQQLLRLACPRACVPRREKPLQ